jgi:hypothetical protein
MDYMKKAIYDLMEISLHYRLIHLKTGICQQIWMLAFSDELRHNVRTENRVQRNVHLKRFVN